MRTRFHSGVIRTILVGLEPIVFVMGGVYAGAIYSGIVGALRSPIA